MYFVYILLCADESHYVGHTSDVAARLREHQQGLGAGHTRARLPVSLAYVEEAATQDAALARERQLKKWSREKRRALIAGDIDRLKMLARRHVR